MNNGREVRGERLAPFRLEERKAPHRSPAGEQRCELVTALVLPPPPPLRTAIVPRRPELGYHSCYSRLRMGRLWLLLTWILLIPTTVWSLFGVCRPTNYPLKDTSPKLGAQKRGRLIGPWKTLAAPPRHFPWVLANDRHWETLR